jgi:hypothetical protein
MPRPSTKNRYIDEVKRLYLEEKKSLGEIRALLGPSVQTLSRWLGEEGVELAARPRNPNVQRTPEEQDEINRRISASQRARVEAGGSRGGRPKTQPTETRHCANPGCEATFDVIATSTQQFCSRSCARTIGNKELWADKRQNTTCPCGVKFYSPYPKKYHSAECRVLYGKKRQADPANHVTFTCQNCGKEVTRRKGLGYHKYCSNACAQRHTKTKQHIVVDDAVVLDSTWEALFWGLCGFFKVPVERHDRSIGIAWRTEKGGWYAPDFTLPGQNIAVEVKGQQRPDDEQKWAAYREQHGQLLVVDRALLDRLRVTADALTFTSLVRLRAS